MALEKNNLKQQKQKEKIIIIFESLRSKPSIKIEHLFFAVVYSGDGRNEWLMDEIFRVSSKSSETLIWETED